MTDLDVTKAQQFFRTDKFVSAAQVTSDSGIRALWRTADIDDYVFDPCGYSMNGIDGAGFITIHITPEAGFSYASVELSGFTGDQLDANALVPAILAIFKPGRAVVSTTVDVTTPQALAWGNLYAPPKGFACDGATCQQLSCGGRVSSYSISAVLGDKVQSPKSPVTHLQQFNSFSSMAIWDSDGTSDGENVSEDSLQADGPGQRSTMKKGRAQDAEDQDNVKTPRLEQDHLITVTA